MCASFFLILPVSALPLVERRRAPGAVLLAMLAAYSGGAGHVVVGHGGRLHRLQGLVGCVASAAAKDGIRTELFAFCVPTNQNCEAVFTRAF